MLRGNQTKKQSISEPVHYEQDTKKVIVLIKKVA